jgi:hypothetical protein
LYRLRFGVLIPPFWQWMLIVPDIPSVPQITLQE